MIILLLVCTLVWHLDNIVINKMFKLETTDKLCIHKLKPQLKRYKKKKKVAVTTQVKYILKP